MSASLARLDASRMRLGVGPTRVILDALGSPDRAFPIVLVAGTNGKGSVSAALAAIATCSGRRCGLFTSPHLEDPRERIRIDGKALSSGELEHHVATTVATAATLGEEPTYFEATVCAAALAFAQAGVDLAVFEVGLGGRLDATNATTPVLAVITAIALDHQEVLGSKLDAIAGEKAGIMRSGVPVLVAPGAPAALSRLENEALRLGAKLEVAALPYGLASGTLSIAGTGDDYRVVPGLEGPHQAQNLMLATRAAERLAELGLLHLEPKAICSGLAAVRWPGRFERVRLVEGTEVIFDGAHNPAGIATLLDALGPEPFDLVFGALADKDVAHMLPPLAAHARRVVLTRPLGTPRALEPEALADLAKRPVVVAATPAAALEVALLDPCPRLVVAGSLYLVGEMRQALRAACGQPLAAADVSTVARE